MAAQLFPEDMFVDGVIIRGWDWEERVPNAWKKRGWWTQTEHHGMQLHLPQTACPTCGAIPGVEQDFVCNLVKSCFGDFEVVSRPHDVARWACACGWSTPWIEFGRSWWSVERLMNLKDHPEKGGYMVREFDSSLTITGR